MKVKDVMTVNVAAVGPQATLKQVAETMLARGVSGLPVVEEGRVLGVVSEGDIIVKAAGKPEPLGVLGRLFPLPTDAERLLAAATAEEAMTAPAETIEADRPVAAAARRMIDRGVNRLPVVSEGKLVGIVSRADIVRAFARPDGDIEDELRNDVILRTLWISPSDLDISVTGGRVKIAGRLRAKADAELLEQFARRVPGVVTVDCSKLAWPSNERAAVR